MKDKIKEYLEEKGRVTVNNLAQALGKESSKDFKEFDMYNLLLTILLVLSVVIVIAIFMQPTKNQSSNVFDASSGDLFERSKARGFEAVMQRLTGILVFFWLAIALALTVLSSR